MQSGKALPNVAVTLFVSEGKTPPLTSKIIVYCAARCVVADKRALSTSTFADEDTYSVPALPSAPLKPPLQLLLAFPPPPFCVNEKPPSPVLPGAKYSSFLLVRPFCPLPPAPPEGPPPPIEHVGAEPAPPPPPPPPPDAEAPNSRALLPDFPEIPAMPASPADASTCIDPKT